MKKETEYFFKMPFSIVENEDLSITDKFLFGIVLNLTNKTGTCTASNAYIADRLKLSIKTIERSFKSLRDNGFIETINIYENGTKRIVRRDTKIVPSKMSFDTLKLSNTTLKNEDTLPLNLSFDTLKNEGDKKINIKEENKRDMNASNDAIFDEDFNICWNLHTQRLKELITKSGNVRRNSKKSECKKVFFQLSKKYSPESISCIVRNDTLRTTPKEFLNLIRKNLDVELLKILNIQDTEVLNEALNSSDNDFLEFIEAIEGQI